MVDGLASLIRTRTTARSLGGFFLSVDKWRYSIQICRPIDEVAMKGSFGTKTSPRLPTRGGKEIQTARPKKTSSMSKEKKSIHRTLHTIE